MLGRGVGDKARGGRGVADGAGISSGVNTNRLPTIAAALALCSAACSAARAETGGATRPASRPAAVAESPATTIPVDPTVDQVLEALHARGDDLRTLSATVAMTEVPAQDNGLGDEPLTRGGRLVVDRTGDAPRVRATFDRETRGTRTVAGDKLEYLLDGDTLTDRTYGTRKSEVRRQVRRGDDGPVDLLAVDGPLPLPVGQPPEDVKKRFEATVVAPAPTDPTGTAHLRLVPRPGSRSAGEFESIDLWPDRADALPRRVETVDKTTIKTTDLSDVELNRPLPDDAFTLPPIDGTWQVTVQPLDPAG